MSITDELRAYTEKQIKWLDMTKVHYHKLFEIADRIDSEYQKELDEWKAKHGQMWLKGYRECHAELLEGNETLASDLESCGWVRLPKDADGEPVRIGDVMEWPTTGETFEVVGIGDGTLFYIDDSSEQADWTGASTKRHHKSPTVEGVLEEMLDAWGELPSNATNEEIIAEYASKLQLRGEDA